MTGRWVLGVLGAEAWEWRLSVSKRCLASYAPRARTVLIPRSREKGAR